jgi:hypothetical protein
MCPIIVQGRKMSEDGEFMYGDDILVYVRSQCVHLDHHIRCCENKRSN